MTGARNPQSSKSTAISVAALIISIAVAYVGVTREDAKTTREQVEKYLEHERAFERRFCRIEARIGLGDCGAANQPEMPLP